jgi:hypothetical protein
MDGGRPLAVTFQGAENAAVERRQWANTGSICYAAAGHHIVGG